MIYTVKLDWGDNNFYHREYTEEQLLAAIRRGELRFSVKNVESATIFIESDEPPRRSDYEITLTR